jgi:hypothetical protein
MKFGGSLPSLPQRGPGHLPDYLFEEGKVACSFSDDCPGGYIARLDDPYVMDRLIRLYQALAERYDTHPRVEQIIITESSAAYEGLDHQGWYRQFRRLISEVGSVWAHTPAVFYMNWIGDPGGFAAHCAASGVGIGAPDILPGPPHPGIEDHGSRALRGAGLQSCFGDDADQCDFGTTDYRGQIPVSYSYQALMCYPEEFGGDGICHLPPAALIDYSLEVLQATHIVWSVVDYLPEGGNWSDGVLPIVESVGGQVGSAACPSRYAGCDTN